MQIKQVITDKFYQNEYVYINGNVYELNYALKLFANNKEAIIKATNKNLKSADAVYLKFKKLPNDYKILQIIDEKKQEILKSLNLKPTKVEKKQRKQAYKIYK